MTGRAHMLNVSQVFEDQSLSPLEKLRTGIDMFFTAFCDDVKTVDELAVMTDKRHKAFPCRCGQSHAIHRSQFREFMQRFMESTPNAEHPEHAEYTAEFRAFNAATRKLKIRDFIEPVLKEREGTYIESALIDARHALKEFTEANCSSELTAHSYLPGLPLVGTYCPIHETTHYLNARQFGEFSKRFNKTPEHIAIHLSETSERIVSRDRDQMVREYRKEFPLLGKKQTKKLNENLRAQAKVAQTTQPPKKPKVSPGKIRVNKRTSVKLPNSENWLYILPPHLMSEEWLIEYSICGRKAPFSKPEAETMAASQKTKNAYQCPYCTAWHVGTQGRKRSLSHQAYNGMFWYKKDHIRANRFIHRIMMEEFSN